jgi:hypothetical protein
MSSQIQFNSIRNQLGMESSRAENAGESLGEFTLIAHWSFNRTLRPHTDLAPFKSIAHRPRTKDEKPLKRQITETSNPALL